LFEVEVAGAVEFFYVVSEEEDGGCGGGWGLCVFGDGVADGRDLELVVRVEADWGSGLGDYLGVQICQLFGSVGFAGYEVVGL
jgi:hypothetical protein